MTSAPATAAGHRLTPEERSRDQAQSARSTEGIDEACAVAAAGIDHPARLEAPPAGEVDAEARWTLDQSRRAVRDAPANLAVAGPCRLAKPPKMTAAMAPAPPAGTARRASPPNRCRAGTIVCAR